MNGRRGGRRSRLRHKRTVAGSIGNLLLRWRGRALGEQLLQSLLRKNGIRGELGCLQTDGCDCLGVVCDDPLALGGDEEAVTQLLWGYKPPLKECN